jgi:hypothetical protein
MKKKKEICLRFKGGIYTFATHCATLKEFYATYGGYKRSDIAEWWYA